MGALVVPGGLYYHRDQAVLLGVQACRQEEPDFLEKVITTIASVPGRDGQPTLMSVVD